MSERKLFDKEEAVRERRRGEWLDLECGAVYVREMGAAQYVTLLERSARPEIDPRGGIDEGEAFLWQVLVSCFTDETCRQRLFDEDDPTDLRIIRNLPKREYVRLVTTIARVNGNDASEEEINRDFTLLQAEQKP